HVTGVQTCALPIWDPARCVGPVARPNLGWHSVVRSADYFRVWCGGALRRRARRVALRLMMKRVVHFRSVSAAMHSLARRVVPPWSEAFVAWSWGRVRRSSCSLFARLPHAGACLGLGGRVVASARVSPLL